MKKSFAIGEALATGMRAAQAKKNRYGSAIDKMAEAGVDLTSANGRTFINACVDAELEYKALFAQAIEDAAVAGVDLRNIADMTFWPMQGVISWDDAKTIADDPGTVNGDEAQSFGADETYGGTAPDEGFAVCGASAADGTSEIL